MLIPSIVLLAVALAAGLFGFVSIASTAASAARKLFVIFLALFAASVMFGAVRGA